jgi:hypothetical protein
LQQGQCRGAIHYSVARPARADKDAPFRIFRCITTVNANAAEAGNVLNQWHWALEAIAEGNDNIVRANGDTGFSLNLNRMLSIFAGVECADSINCQLA